MLHIDVEGVSYPLDTILSGFRSYGELTLPVYEVMNLRDVERASGITPIHLHDYPALWNDDAERVPCVVTTHHGPEA